MAASKKVSVILEGKETVSDAARRAGDSVQGLENRGRSLGESWAVAITGVNQALELLGKAAQVVGQLYDQARLGAQASQVRAAFESMAESAGLAADQMVSKLRDASAQTISEMELMSSANRALLFEIPADQLDELMAIARASATATGASVQQMFDDIVTGIGRASPMILDNLGLTLRIGEANDAYAASLGKTADELTSSERKQAILNATLEAGESLMNRVGDAATELTDLEKMQQFESAWQDFKVVVGEVLADVFTPMLDTTARMLTNITNAIREARNLRDQLSIVTTSGASAVAESNIATAITAVQREINTILSSFRSQGGRIPGFAAIRESGVLDQGLSMNQIITAIMSMEDTVYTQRLRDLAEQLRDLIDLQKQATDRERYGQYAEPAPPGITEPSTGGSGGAGTAAVDDFVNMLDYSTTKLANARFTAVTWFENLESDFEALGFTVEDGVVKSLEALDISLKRGIDGIELFDVSAKRLSDDLGNIHRTINSFENAVRDDERYPSVPFRIGSQQMDWGLGDLSLSGGIESILGGFGDVLGQVGQIAMAFSSIAALANPVTILLDGLTDTLGGLVDGALAPVIGMIRQMGVVIGTMLKPAIQTLTPIIEAYAKAWVWMYNEVFVPVFNTIRQMWNRIYNFVVGIINWIINALNKIPGVNISNIATRDVNDGTLDRISLDDMTSAGDTYIGGSTGDNTTVTRPPDIYIYQTFQGPIIGQAGMAQVGEFMGEALIAYTGIGGRLIFEDASGNQTTVGVVA